MARIDFEFRILCDKNFLTWVFNHETHDKRQILRKMMGIKSSSLYHPKSHIVILEEDFNDKEFQKLVKLKLKEQEHIRGVVKPYKEPPFLTTEQNIISKYIRYAIFLSNSRPYKVCILTDTETEQKYRENGHMTGVNATIFIMSNQKSLNLIDKFFNQIYS